MKILLLNENPMVSRLINLSAKKMSYELTELAEYSDELGTYDTIIVDNDIEADLPALKEKCKQLIFLSPRDKPCEVDAEILHKPFLPTDFLNLLSGESVKIDDSISVEPLGEGNIYENMKFNLDELNLEDLPDDNAGDLSLESLSLDESEQAARQEDKALDEDLNLDTNEALEQEFKADETSENLEAEQNLQSEAEPELEISQGESLSEAEAKAENLAEIQTEAEGENSTEPEAEILTESENLSEIQTETEPENSTEIQAEAEPENLTEPEIQSENLTEPEIQTEPETEKENLELPQVEEKEIDFDDLPKDAEFLGQEKESPKDDDFVPLVEEELPKPKEEENTELSAQEQIKEELAALDELDAPQNAESKVLQEFEDIETEITPEELEIPDEQEDGSKVLEEFKDEPILSINEEKLGIENEEVVVPNLDELSEFDDLKESEIQRALGEEVSDEPDELLNSQSLEPQENLTQPSDELVSELSHNIAQSIASNIKDDALKAALKGMNMNINIKIRFDEDKI